MEILPKNKIWAGVCIAWVGIIMLGSAISVANSNSMAQQFWLLLVLGNCMLGLVPAVIAHSKGRSFWGWWLVGTLIWIMALPAAIMIKRSDVQ